MTNMKYNISIFIYVTDIQYVLVYTISDQMATCSFPSVI